MKAMTLLISVSIGACALLAQSSAAEAQVTSAACQVADVAVFDNRVHIHCGPSPASAGVLEKMASDFGKLQSGEKLVQIIPVYFAVEAGSKIAAQVVELGISALINRRAVDIFYEANSAANPAGCLTSDCRRLTGLVMR
jgi:hypothetical protein